MSPLIIILPLIYRTLSQTITLQRLQRQIEEFQPYQYQLNSVFYTDSHPFHFTIQDLPSKL